jgi:hypothetical protein
MKDHPRRLLSKLDTSGGGESCWPYLGAITGHGYGNFAMNGRWYGAHKAAYLLFVVGGTSPDEHRFEVDHRCHTRDNCVGGSSCLHRRCCNPSHLQLVTHRTNDLRGLGVSAANIRVEACPRGHPYDEINTYRRPGVPEHLSKRDCRACRREAGRRYRESRKAAL